MVSMVQMEKVRIRSILPIPSYNSQKDSENSYDRSHISVEETEIYET